MVGGCWGRGRGLGVEGGVGGLMEVEGRDYCDFLRGGGLGEIGLGGLSCECAGVEE